MQVFPTQRFSSNIIDIEREFECKNNKDKSFLDEDNYDEVEMDLDSISDSSGSYLHLGIDRPYLKTYNRIFPCIPYFCTCSLHT